MCKHTHTHTHTHVTVLLRILAKCIAAEITDTSWKNIGNIFTDTSECCC